MNDAPSPFERFVDALPATRLFQFIAKYILVPFWAWRVPVAALPGGPAAAAQPSENLQHMMNLVMPLKDKTPIGRAMAALAIAQNVDEIYAGLNNVGTVHFARFVLLDGNLCMFSDYDGDFSNYIRDFIFTIGSVFNAIVALVEGGEEVLPCEQNVEAFIDWVHARDMYQVPDLATDIFAQQKAVGDVAERDDLRRLPRDLILQLHANPNVSLGSGYRGYPAFSVAQIRQRLGIGW